MAYFISGTILLLLDYLLFFLFPSYKAKSQPDSAQGFWMTFDINILGSKVVRTVSASRAASGSTQQHTTICNQYSVLITVESE